MHISKKKPAFNISTNLRHYLKKYNREASIPITYDDLKGWYDAMPLYDVDGEDTLWNTVVYSPSMQDEIENALVQIYALLKTGGDLMVIKHLRLDRVDYCRFGNSNPFRVRIINSLNDIYDYFYVKRADASRVYGLDLEHILSPNKIEFLVDGSTLVEEHIPGIPGDVFLESYMDSPNLFPKGIAKEFVKFNERCFTMLLGDMRSYNYIVDITPDFDKEQYRVRAIDFDQLCYEGRKNHYLPQFYKENNKIVQFCLEKLPPETIYQYMYEERILIKKRYNLEKLRLLDLLNSMQDDTLSVPEKRNSLINDLNKYHNTTDFSLLGSMGQILQLHLSLMLERPKPQLRGMAKYKSRSKNEK
ncbi:MAG: hypothetical protein MK212_04630 [Saprospiraceae bacterium]|nr:hypothetical protein [Saprospiraceae bacterium]